MSFQDRTANSCSTVLGCLHGQDRWLGAAGVVVQHPITVDLSPTGALSADQVSKAQHPRIVMSHTGMFGVAGRKAEIWFELKFSAQLHEQLLLDVEVSESERSAPSAGPAAHVGTPLLASVHAGSVGGCIEAHRRTGRHSGQDVGRAHECRFCLLPAGDAAPLHVCRQGERRV